MSVKRVYVEKKPEFAVKAGELREEIGSNLSIDEGRGRYRIFRRVPSGPVRPESRLCRAVREAVKGDRGAGHQNCDHLCAFR